jgi:hypothetical protein
LEEDGEQNGGHKINGSFVPIQVLQEAVLFCELPVLCELAVQVRDQKLLERAKV